MKVTVVHGSPRKNGGTRHATELFLDEMRKQGEISVSEYFMPNDLPAFCRGCAACVISGEQSCPHAEYTLPILKSMLEADALIFTTPVYVMAESGSIKNFLDHFCYLFLVHRPQPEMFSKKAFVIGTALGPTGNLAMKTIRTSLRYWCVNRVYSRCYAMMNMGWENIPERHRKKLEAKIASDAQSFYFETASGKRHAPYIFLRFIYFFVKLLRKKYAGGEKSLDELHWEKYGWMDKSPF